jgi:MFS family permease
VAELGELSPDTPGPDAAEALVATTGSVMLLGASAAQAACSFMVLGLPAIGPQLRQQFGLSLVALGALLVTMQFGTGVGLVWAGKAADRWGARAATRAGSVGAAVGLTLGAAAPSVVVLCAGLFLAGAASAVIPVAGASAIFRTYPMRRHAWALGVRQVGVPVGGMVAAICVPALDVAGGARLVLVAGAVVIVIAGVAFAAVSDETRIQHDSSVRFVRGIWSGPGLGRLLVVALAYLFVLQTVLSYSVPAMRGAGFSTLDAGIGYFAVNVAAIASRLAWGWVADRDDGNRRERTLVELGLLAGVGAVLFGLALHGSLVVVLPMLMFYAFAAVGWNALVYALAGEWTTPELSGRAFAVAATVVFAGSAVVAPAIGGLAGWLGWDSLWPITAGFALVGAAAARLLPKRR